VTGPTENRGDFHLHRRAACGRFHSIYSSGQLYAVGMFLISLVLVGECLL
jgi:hypothetical protein